MNGRMVRKICRIGRVHSGQSVTKPECDRLFVYPIGNRHLLISPAGKISYRDRTSVICRDNLSFLVLGYSEIHVINVVV